MAIVINQGDQYAIPFTITRGGETATSEDIEKLEVFLGCLHKTYPGDIEYYSATGQFLFPLLQSESIRLFPDSYPVRVRAKFQDGTIRGEVRAGTVQVREMRGVKEL